MVFVSNGLTEPLFHCTIRDMSQLTTLQTDAVDPDQLLSVTKAAELLGVNRMWLSGYLARAGLLRRVGTCLSVRRRDLDHVELPRKKEA